MEKQHWIMLAVVLVIGYALGMYYPNVGKDALSKVGV